MITLVEGMIGAGKTYYVVQDVLGRYCKFDEVSLSWKLLDDNVVLYSNVDRFIIANDLMLAISSAGGLNKFFTVEFQRKFAREKKHVYIIDEAQSPMFFHRKFYDAEVFYFFQYHRHLGVDIYLITQDIKTLAKELQSLNEFHIRAVRRSYSFMKEFRYNFMVGNDIFRRKILRRDLRIFSAFRSSSEIGAQKIRSFARSYFIYVGLFMFVAVFGFYSFIKFYWGPPSPRKVNTVVQSKSSDQFKIVALNSDNALVKHLGSKKIQRVSYNDITGDLRIGAIVNVSM